MRQGGGAPYEAWVSTSSCSWSSNGSSSSEVRSSPSAVRDAIYHLLHATGCFTLQWHEASARAVRAVIAAQQLPATYPTDLAARAALGVKHTIFDDWKRRLRNIRGDGAQAPPSQTHPPAEPQQQRAAAARRAPPPTASSSSTSSESSERSRSSTPSRSSSPPQDDGPPQDDTPTAAREHTQWTGRLRTIDGGHVPPPPSAQLTPTRQAAAPPPQQPTLPRATSPAAQAPSPTLQAEAPLPQPQLMQECTICGSPLTPEGALETTGDEAWGHTPCCGAEYHRICLSRWLAGGRTRSRQFVAFDGMAGVLCNTQQVCPLCREPIVARAMKAGPRADRAGERAGPSSAPAPAPPVPAPARLKRVADKTEVGGVPSRRREACAAAAQAIIQGLPDAAVEQKLTLLCHAFGSTNPKQATVDAAKAVILRTLRPGMLASDVAAQEHCGVTASSFTAWARRLRPLLGPAAQTQADPEADPTPPHAAPPPPPPAAPDEPAAAGTQAPGLLLRRVREVQAQRRLAREQRPTSATLNATAVTDAEGDWTGGPWHQTQDGRWLDYPPPPPSAPPSPPPEGGALGSTSMGTHNLNMIGNMPIAQEVACTRDTAFGNCFIGHKHPQLNDRERTAVCAAFHEAAARLAEGEMLRIPDLAAVATTHGVLLKDGTPMDYSRRLVTAMGELTEAHCPKPAPEVAEPRFTCSRSCEGKECHGETLLTWWRGDLRRDKRARNATPAKTKVAMSIDAATPTPRGATTPQRPAHRTRRVRCVNTAAHGRKRGREPALAPRHRHAAPSACAAQPAWEAEEGRAAMIIRSPRAHTASLRIPLPPTRAPHGHAEGGTMGGPGSDAWMISKNHPQRLSP